MTRIFSKTTVVLTAGILITGCSAGIRSAVPLETAQSKVSQIHNKPNGTSLKTAKLHCFEGMLESNMLNDQCATSIEGLNEFSPLSLAVKWQTKSAEYKYITTIIYQNASTNLIAQIKPNTPWVVVMDIDETILDNSAYQTILDLTKQEYSPETWKAWVQSKKAGLVPGSQSFIDVVIAAGGKLALITNRDKSLDSYTWYNLLDAGLPIDSNNTCLIGRTAKDVESIDGITIFNDKDLRRKQITSGNVDCFTPQGDNSAHWQQTHKVLMQVGDNIQDISGVQQETANIKQLISNFGDAIVIIPNPMYGSW